MSVTSFTGLRPGADSLVGGSSFAGGNSSNLKKSHLSVPTSTTGINSTNLRSMAGGEIGRKNHVSSTTPTDVLSSSTTNNGTTSVPTIKVTPAPNIGSSGNNNLAEASSTTASTTGGLLPKAYGKIVLTLENVLLPDEKLSPTPSSLDGLEEESEIDLRIMGCELITTAGILLKLPQVRKIKCYILL